MIWALGIGQLRANRGYFLRTVSLLALLVATLTHVIVIGATQAELDKKVATIWAQDFNRHGSAVVTDASSWPYAIAVEPAQLRELIDSTPGSVATVQSGVRTVPIDEYTWDGVSDYLAVFAAYGARDASFLLESGRLPTAAGEIAIARDQASAMGWSLGDAVTLYADVWVPSSDDPNGGTIGDAIENYTLVGLLTPSSMPGFQVWAPSALVSWADVESSDGFLSRPSPRDEFGQRGTYVNLAWDGSSPALDRFFEWDGGEWREGVILPESSGVWFTLAGVLAAAMIIMSFAVGRSQAAARSGWIATARTLGATKRDVALATIAETVIMAGIAMVFGVGVGILAAQAQLSLAVAQSGVPFAPSTVSLHWAIIPAVASATLLVTIAIAAVPAFWAARVPPVAALKPVNDITEAELSRRVSPHWLWIPTVLGTVLVAAASFQLAEPMDLVFALGVVMASIGVAGLAIEATRSSIPSLGRRLARSTTPSRLTAGDALVTRPRLAVAPALIALAATAAMTLFILNFAVNQRTALERDGWFAYGDQPSFSEIVGWSRAAVILAVVAGSVLIQLVAAAIFVAHRSSTRAEMATRRALGLSARHEERSQWWRQMVPQTLGCAMGVTIAVAVFVLGQGVQRLVDPAHGTPFTSVILPGIGVALAGTVILLAAAAIAAWLTARIGRTARPLAQLSHSG